MSKNDIEIVLIKIPEQTRQKSLSACERGNAYLKKKEYDMAIKEYSEAIRLDPNFAVPYYHRAEIYYYKKEYDLAIKDYTESIRLDTDHVMTGWAYYKRGEIHYMKKEYDLAFNDHLEAVKHPGFPEFSYINAEKCSFCGLPYELTHGSIAIGNDKFICGKCINKAETMERIKLENDKLYQQIIEDYQRYLEFHKKIDAMDTSKKAIRLTNPTIEELNIDKLDYGELQDLFDSYTEINIMPSDYQRIISIVKRMKLLLNEKSNSQEISQRWGNMIVQMNDKYNNIIESMEDLIKTNALNFE
ncbi:tetratricopeptide repeat domain protein [Treponema sp. R8-4-B8]